MTLTSRLVEYISACFTGIWIQSHEHSDALKEIAQMCRQENWRLAAWDVERGLQVTSGTNGQTTDASGTDPLAAIRSVNALAVKDGSALLVMVNFHRFLNSAEVVQALVQQINAGKQNRTFVIVLSPVVQIPSELEKLFIVLEHDLPDRPQLEGIAREIATEDGELPAGEALNTVLDAAAGLTRFEAEGAFSLSLVRHRRIEPEAIWELKSGMLKKSGLLTLHRGGERFEDLGGLDNLKAFCTRSLRQQGHSDPRRRPKGVLLLSPPGCGKSQFCKALGNEVGRPTLILDVGSLMGSLVGQTESNVRQALKIADAMAPKIRQCATNAFRHLSPEARAEAVQDVVCNAMVAFIHLYDRGKTDLAYPTVLARYGIAQHRCGRRVGTKLNIRDACSPYAAAMRGIQVERLDRYNEEEQAWKEILVADDHASPAELAASRIDFPAWLATLSRRDKKIAMKLAWGESTGTVARLFRITAGRVSQLRRELRDAWLRFHGEDPAPSVA